MYKITTLNKISDTGLAAINNSDFVISSDEKNPDGIILRSFDMHTMELPKSLKCVARAGAGVNNIPIDKCTEQGIVVFNTPGANANAVKELVIAALMMSSRKIFEGINWAQSLAGQTDVAKLIEKGKGDFVGPEISGKTLGVIGLGAIGILVANAAHSLGMNVIGYDPFMSVEAAWSISRSVQKAASLDEIYEKSDYIAIHVPFNKETKNMINEETLAKCKDGVRIINIARGELVDNTAIKAAVASGKVACYVTDFPNEEVLGVKGIITIPHLGASSPESEENCAQMAAAELKDFLLCGNIKNSVNLPNCEMPWTDKTRICIIHKNIPNMINSVTAAVAKKNINIDNMLNKSKGDYSYTMLDVDNAEISGVEDELMSVDGIVSVRVI